jgi:two-component system KDP operon response regulator KdpE
VAESISLCLQMRWPEVNLTNATEGTKGIEQLKAGSFDLIILDLNLPDIDGLEVLKRIRSFTQIPIIIVTVRGSEQEQVIGLEMGADDYIVKPFRPRDLVARVNAVLRRTQETKPSEEHPFIVRGQLSLNIAADEVSLQGRTIKLTATESRLLYVLMKNPGQTLAREEIFKQAWGENYPSGETLRSYIRKLRDKLGDNPPRIILTERGQGYRLVSPSE